MAETTERLQRYLDEEIRSCRVEAVEDRVEALDALEATIDDTRLDNELAVLSALGGETRYKLVRVLVAAEEELCVCELDSVVDKSESAISHALATLRAAGLVTRRKEGRWRKYRATDAAISIVTALDGVDFDE